MSFTRADASGKGRDHRGQSSQDQEPENQSTKRNWSNMSSHPQPDGPPENHGRDRYDGHAEHLIRQPTGKAE